MCVCVCVFVCQVLKVQRWRGSVALSAERLTSSALRQSGSAAKECERSRFVFMVPDAWCLNSNSKVNKKH